MNRKVYVNKEEFEKENSALGDLLPYSEDISSLKAPLEILGDKAHNRLVCQAMEG